MKKYTEINKNNEELFRGMIEETALSEVVRFSFLSDCEANEAIEVKKFAPIPKAVSALEANKPVEKGVDLVVIINEDIFDRLPDEMQVLAIKHAIHPISFNSEKDSITIDKPDIKTYSDFLEHIDVKDLIMLTEGIKSIKDKLANDKE